MIVTDNSLCNIDFSPKVTEQNVHEYIISLFESGIDLVEIDFRTYKFFKEINTSKRFIMRVDTPSDLMYAHMKEFYYVAIPYSMLPLAEKLTNSKYLVEIDGDKYNNDQLLKMCREISEKEFVGAVRIAKNFDADTEELSDFIDRYYDEFTMPLDICPLNSHLTGLDAAYKAFSKGVNTITMGFGASCFYTPYELFVMYFPENFRIHPQITLIPYLLICAARYNLVSDEFNKGLDNIVNVLDNYKRPVANADSAYIDGQRLKRAAGRKDENYDVFSSAQNNFFNESDLDLDYSGCKKLSEVLDSSDLILYNRFFDDKGFKN